jgi:hypothetical protein
MSKLILIIIVCFLGQIHAQNGAPFIATQADSKAGIFQDMDDSGPKRGICLFVLRPCDTDSTKSMSARAGYCNEADPPYTIFQILPSTYCAIAPNNSQDSTQLRVLTDLPEPLITFLQNTKADFNTDSVKIAQKWVLDTKYGWTQDDRNKFKVRGYVAGQATGQLRIEARVCALCH